MASSRTWRSVVVLTVGRSDRRAASCLRAARCWPLMTGRRRRLAVLACWWQTEGQTTIVGGGCKATNTVPTRTTQYIIRTGISRCSSLVDGRGLGHVTHSDWLAARVCLGARDTWGGPWGGGGDGFRIFYVTHSIQHKPLPIIPYHPNSCGIQEKTFNTFSWKFSLKKKLILYRFFPPIVVFIL